MTSSLEHRGMTERGWVSVFLLFFIGMFFLTSKGWAKRLPIQVAVSIPPQAYFVKQIGGQRVRVTALLPPGANPATYEPKAKTLMTLSKEEIYFRIHVPFEDAWMEKFRAVNRRMVVVDTTKGIRKIHHDPHIWLAPTMVERQARIICKALEKQDPSGKEFYEENLLDFKQKLSRLDNKIRNYLKNVKRKTFLVYHPCWGYFAKEFGLSQVALEREGKAPGAATLVRIIKMAHDKGIRCVFAQPQFDTRSARIVASQIHGRLVLIDPLAEDWDRNLLRVAEKIAHCLGSRE